MEYSKSIEVAVNDINNCVNLSRESLKFLKKYNTSIFIQFSEYLDRISTSSSYIQSVVSSKPSEVQVSNKSVCLTYLTDSISSFAKSANYKNISSIEFSPADMSYGKSFETQLSEFHLKRLLDSIFKKAVNCSATKVYVSSAFADGKFLVRVKDNSKLKNIKSSSKSNKFLNLLIDDSSRSIGVKVSQLNWIDGHEVQLIFTIIKRVHES